MAFANVRIPDLFVEIDANTMDEKEMEDERNANLARRRLYLATRHVLASSFCYGEARLATLADAEPEDVGYPLSVIPVNLFALWQRVGPIFGVADGVGFEWAPMMDEQTSAVLAINGLMYLRGYDDPTLGVTNWSQAAGDEMVLDPLREDLPLNDYPAPPVPAPTTYNFRAARDFIDQVIEAVKDFNSHRGLFVKVVDELLEIGKTGVAQSVVRAEHVADVTMRLIGQDVDENHPQLNLLIRNALAQTLRGAPTEQASLTDIDLPDLDLDAGSAADIVADNVLALSGVYMAAMLEEMRYFQVADVMAQQFIQGSLPIVKGEGGQYLYQYTKDAINRFTEQDRRDLYARAFGFAQGGVDVQLPNREFQDLWIRFLSAVTMNIRQSPGEKMLVSREQIHKSARDLGVNLSLHGYAISHFFAVELQKLIKDVHRMLGHPDLLRTFGVRDQWQLVDRVAQTFLGASVNTVRYRVMARSGAKIIQWISRKAAVIGSPYTLSATEFFQEVELVDFAERWLAVTGTPDNTVEQFSDPVVIPTQSTIPSLSLAAGPPSIEEALDQVGAVAPDMI